MSISVYEIVTGKILDALDRGAAPWQKPWNSSVARPINAVSGKPYRGINTILLGMCGEADPRWLTFRQVESLGGRVKKGSHSTLIVFWQINENGREVEDGDEQNSRTSATLRYYNVFNVSQCTGLLISEGGKLVDLVAPTAKDDIQPVDAAESIVANMPNAPMIQHGHKNAAYSPSFDRVTMPHRESFNIVDGYYGVLYHELIHSTGHVSRLARQGVTDPISFGSQTYAQEELVAEIGSAFLMAEAGIPPNIENSASYLEGWRKSISDDKRLIIRAASQAQKAAEYIVGRAE